MRPSYQYRLEQKADSRICQHKVNTTVTERLQFAVVGAVDWADSLHHLIGEPEITTTRRAVVWPDRFSAR